MKEAIAVKDIVTVSTGEFIASTLKSFQAFVENDLIDEHPAIFVTGQPGIGKSQSVREIARRLGSKTDREVTLTDIRLLLFNPIDLRGIPVADLKERIAVWLRPQIFSMNGDASHINILFLDELTAAPSSVQAAAYQIALDKRIGEHALPPNTFIIAAGNRTEDHSVVYEMPAALKNRFMHFEIKNDFQDWMSWAAKKEIHPEILKYLKYNPHRLNAEKFASDTEVIVTPRSWEMLSKILKTIGGSLKSNRTIVASLLGTALTELILDHNSKIDVESIWSGQYKEVPDSLSEVQNLVDLLISTIDHFMVNRDRLKNVIDYLHLLPLDYGIKLFRRIVRYHDPVCPLNEIDSFNDYVKKIGDALEE
ncbi:MAG: AAA family ATPase [Acholeplasmataceae bacterium]